MSEDKRILTPDGKWEWRPLPEVIMHPISEEIANMVEGMTDRQLELHCRRCGQSLSAHSYSGWGYQYPNHRDFQPIRETHKWVEADK